MIADKYLFITLSVIINVKLISGAAIIGNGEVILGVDDEGQLNVPYYGGFLGLPTTDPLDKYVIGLRNGGSGTVEVGEYAATEAGCLCEGWGVGISNLGIYVSANNDDGISNINLVGFSGSNGDSNATSHIRDTTNNFEVIHHFYPSPDSIYAMKVDVTIKNIGAQTFTNIIYRRTMDWDIYPTPFSEYVTIIGTDADKLILSNDNGFCSSNPFDTCLEYTAGTTNVDFTDNGPSDRGANFDFDLGDLNPGEETQITIHYGCAPGEVAALQSLHDIGAEVASLGQSAVDGLPHTFFFAFGKVDGTVIEAPPTSSPTTAEPTTDSPTTARPTTNAPSQAPTQGILAGEDICFMAPGYHIGYEFNPPMDGEIYGIRLVHKRGSVTCKPSSPGTNWGCANTDIDGDVFGVQMVEVGGNTYYPTQFTDGVGNYYPSVSWCPYECDVSWYKLNQTLNDDEILLIDGDMPYQVTTTQTFSLQYGEGCCLTSTFDNNGESCADVYFLYNYTCPNYDSSCPPDTTNERNYVLPLDNDGNSITEYSYDDANQYCIDRYGTTLATVITGAEADKIALLAEPYNFYWYSFYIGLNDRNVEGEFEWIDGTCCEINDGSGLCTSLWNSGEPNTNGNNEEDCVSMIIEGWAGGSMKWDLSCPSSTLVVCNEPCPFIDNFADLTADPTADPTSDPTSDPTNDPTADPTADPTSDPTTDPTSDPTNDPTIDPTADPTADPTTDPTNDPTSDPTNDPTADPSSDPTSDPTADPTSDPTIDPIDCNGDCTCSSTRYCILNCDTKDACIDSELNCDGDNKDCYVICSKQASCKGNTEINANGAKVFSVLCSGEDSCQDADIDASDSNEFDITCSGKSSCKGNTCIKCPISGKKGDCAVACGAQDSCTDLTIIDPAGIYACVDSGDGDCDEITVKSRGSC